MNHEEIIEFLCPNGHKLSGPASLQGRPGQCPHCQSKFVIPDYSEFGAEDKQEAIAAMAATTGAQQLEALPDVEDLEGIAAEDTAIASLPPPGLFSDATLNPTYESIHLLFEQLWARRREGTLVELHLSNGSVMQPEFYSPISSGPNQGLFATRDADGSFTLAAVTWSSVTQVALRGVMQLPGDLFGG